MASKKRNRNLPTKKSQKAVQALFPGARITKFQVGPYLVNENLSFFEQVTHTENVYLQCAAAIVAVHLLCQIRVLKPSSKPTEIDRLPSFKFYKKALISGNPGLALSFALAVSDPAVVVELPEDDTEGWLRAVFESFQGNEKRLQSVNSSNVSEYVNGEMSRIQGILNSTPSNNHALLGINETKISNFSISDCLAEVGFVGISSINPDEIAALIRDCCGIMLNEDGSLRSVPVTFDEPPLIEPGSVNGGCVLEQEIFGSTGPNRRSQTPTKSTSGKASPTIHSDELLEATLSPLQVRKYKAAVYLTKNDVINRLNTIIEKAISSGAF